MMIVATSASMANPAAISSAAADMLLGRRAEGIRLGGKSHEDLVQHGVRGHISPRSGKSLGLDPQHLPRQGSQYAGHVASRECRIHPAYHLEITLHCLLWVSSGRSVAVSIRFTMINSHDQSSESIAAASEVDVLSDMLRSVRLTGSMLFLVEASTPWVSWAPQTESFQRLVLPAAQHLISFHIVTRGGCWAGLAGAPPERFEAGDVLVIPHGDAYYLADPPAGSAPTTSRRR
jgi:hypothetical protein